MFKKKTNLPPRPKRPGTNQMIEDLSAVENDDPIFMTAKTILERNQVPDDLSDKDGAYQRINSFFKSHNELKEVLENLKVASTSLSEKECDMMKAAEELKNQAIKGIM